MLTLEEQVYHLSFSFYQLCSPLQSQLFGNGNLGGPGKKTKHGQVRPRWSVILGRFLGRQVSELKESRGFPFDADFFLLRIGGTKRANGSPCAPDLCRQARLAELQAMKAQKLEEEAGGVPRCWRRRWLHLLWLCFPEALKI